MRIVTLLLVAVASLGLAGRAVAAADAPASPTSYTGEDGKAVQEEPASSTEPAAASEPAAAETAPPAETVAAAPAPAPKRKPTLGPVGHDAAGQRGRIHTVASGDTLWDISDAYLGTPWVWPSIWDDNPKVPNPHRIFPGDKLWISPTAMRRVTDEEAQRLLDGELPASFDDAMPGPLGTITVPTIDAVGFVSAEMLAASGAILGSPRADRWYSAEMVVYLSLGEGQVEKGDRFTVVRAEEEVVDPETDRSMGLFVDRLGWVEVTAVHAESSEAVIRSSAREMQIGDRILPRVEPSREVTVRSASPPVEGQVTFLPDIRTINAGLDVVFLNRGSEHGLLVGSPLEVFRSSGSAEDAETGMQRMLPDDVVASLVVVSAEPTSALAVVTHAREEIARGDQFRGSSAR